MTVRSSPLQNRMTPRGDLEAVPARGLFTGNRGVLHNEYFTVGPARWKHRNWIICALSFKDRHRAVMTPRRWTELFFLDEAVALAVGHRPCAECRWAAYNDWMDAASAEHPATRFRASEADAILHKERALPGARELRRHVMKLEDLPDGAFILTSDSVPALVRGKYIHPWSHTGYGAPARRGFGESLLLTPPTNIAALRAGYRPHIHPSAQFSNDA